MCDSLVHSMTERQDREKDAHIDQLSSSFLCPFYEVLETVTVERKLGRRTDARSPCDCFLYLRIAKLG
jgi:hypothetical protein